MKNDGLMINIVIQYMLAIMTFHQLNYIHTDAHGGNFLYHKIDEMTGYYYYHLI
jgi:predicted unusual protein kinase regulating ubiquinone biosynthesis (AarF/ABC1/UbiB family)